MDNVQWIKLKVGMFDGESFKKIKRAKIGGESFRDKLTAVWFELMDFAGKCNHSGFFINSREIPFQSIDDIAVMIDRTSEELDLCMKFFVNEGMVEIIDDVYALTNWTLYQNEEKLEKIREQKRISQAKWRMSKKLKESDTNESVDSTVGSTQMSTDLLPSYSLSNSNSSNPSNEKEKRGVGRKEKTSQPVTDEITAAIRELPPVVQSQMRDWLEYKTERKEIYAPRGLKSLLTMVKKSVDKYGGQAVADVIESSMGSNYVGIVWDNLSKGQGYQKPRSKDTLPTDYGSPEDFYK